MLSLGFMYQPQASAGHDRVGFKGQDAAYTKNSDREEYMWFYKSRVLCLNVHVWSR